MFGYIKPFKPELKICEYNAYKSVYCGLCGQLGKSFGPAARLTLSYDFTFLSMLYYSLSNAPAPISQRRCFVNPLKKTPCANESEALRFASDIAAVMLYYKLLDNIADSKFAKAGWICLRPFFAQARKKAAAARPDAELIIREAMRLQSEIEASMADSLDEACEPTATAMAKLFELMTADDKTRRILFRFGYFIGRYVYICDALDDIENDLKHGGYNPLILHFKLAKRSLPVEINAAKDFAKQSLYMTIGEAAKAYDLLILNEFKPILDNIIALGLRFSVDQLLSKDNLKDKKEQLYDRSV